MPTALSARKELAMRLLSLEAIPIGLIEGNLDGAIRVIEKLRVPFARLAGATGYASLLLRALILAESHAPSLHLLQVKADGTLSLRNELRQQLEKHDKKKPEEAGDSAATVLVTQLLELLVTFIGEPLTLMLVLDAWPDEPSEKLAVSAEVPSS